jgi:hypothetical protein
VPSHFPEHGRLGCLGWYTGARGNFLHPAGDHETSLQVDVDRRYSHGLAIRGVYTWSKSLDDGDSLNATAAANAVALLSNPYVPGADQGLATYDVRNIGVVTASYELPFGQHGTSPC